MNDLKQLGHSIKVRSIIGLCLAFTLIGVIVTLILNIICGVQVLSTDWKNQKLNSDKTLWGVFCFVLLGPIFAIIWGDIVEGELANVNASTPS